MDIVERLDQVIQRVVIDPQLWNLLEIRALLILAKSGDGHAGDINLSLLIRLVGGLLFWIERKDRFLQWRQCTVVIVVRRKVDFFAMDIRCYREWTGSPAQHKVVGEVCAECSAQPFLDDVRARLLKHSKQE